MNFGYLQALKFNKLGSLALYFHKHFIFGNQADSRIRAKKSAHKNKVLYSSFLVRLFEQGCKCIKVRKYAATLCINRKMEMYTICKQVREEALIIVGRGQCKNIGADYIWRKKVLLYLQQTQHTGGQTHYLSASLKLCGR